MRNVRVIGFVLAMLAGGWGGAQAQVVDGLDVQRLFGQLDTNDDMEVVSNEVPESGRPAFEQLLKLGDLNNNGKLELEEFRAFTVVIGQDAGPEAPGSKTPRQIIAMDKDEDGKVNKEEYQGPSNRFERLDADKDGFLTRREATAVRAGGESGTPPSGRTRRLMGMPTARFEGLDADIDGKVSKQEYQGPAARFDRLDADEDGFVTKEETAAMAGRDRELSAKRFRAMDQDDDGKLSKEEYRGPGAPFDRLDADEDGYLTEREISRRPGLARGSVIVRGPFQGMDRDANRKLSPDEFRGRRQAFNRLDADQDGSLSARELRAGRRAQGKTRSTPPVRPETKSEASGAEKKGEVTETPYDSGQDKATETVKSPPVE